MGSTLFPSPSKEAGFFTYRPDLRSCFSEQGEHLVLAACFLNDGFLRNDSSLQDVCAVVSLVRLRIDIRRLSKTNLNPSCKARFGLYLEDTPINLISPSHGARGGLTEIPYWVNRVVDVQHLVVVECSIVNISEVPQSVIWFRVDEDIASGT